MGFGADSLHPLQRSQALSSAYPISFGTEWLAHSEKSPATVPFSTPSHLRLTGLPFLVRQADTGKFCHHRDVPAAVATSVGGEVEMPWKERIHELGADREVERLPSGAVATIAAGPADLSAERDQCWIDRSFTFPVSLECRGSAQDSLGKGLGIRRSRTLR